MPTSKTPRRLTKRAVPPVRATKRRTVKTSAAEPVSGTPDALLIAKFAEALGRSPDKPPRKGRRTLAQALQQGSAMDDPIALMPGARVAPSIFEAPSNKPLAPAPCLAAAQRRRRNGHISGAASWCVAFLVTAGIISAAAYGFVAQAPRSAAPITTASAAQF